MIRQPLIVRLSKMRREKRRNRGMTVAEGNVWTLESLSQRGFSTYICVAAQTRAPQPAAINNGERIMNTRNFKTLCLMMAAAAAVPLAPQSAQAFWGHRRVTTAYALPTTPVAVGYAPVAVARPVVAAPVVAAYAPAPVTTYYAPAATVAAPVTSYYAPAATAAPVTTYYAPPATVAAPVTAYYAPARVVGPPVGGPVTSYYAPTVAAPVYAPRATVLGRPVIWVP